MNLRKDHYRIPNFSAKPNRTCRASCLPVAGGSRRCADSILTFWRGTWPGLSPTDRPTLAARWLVFGRGGASGGSSRVARFNEIVLVDGRPAASPLGASRLFHFVKSTCVKQSPRPARSHRTARPLVARTTRYETKAAHASVSGKNNSKRWITRLVCR